MQKRYQHNPAPPKSRGYFLFAVVFTLVAAGLWFVINRENLHEFSETHRNREKAQLEIAKTKQRIAQLRRQQQSLMFNGVESEKQIRERLQMHRPGEKVMLFENESKTSPAVPMLETSPILTETSTSASPGRTRRK